MEAGQIRSRQRVSDHGEVFTPEWMVEAMLDLVKAETEIVKTTFLESACGNGNFLVPILKRKLAAVDRDYGQNDFERRHYALLGLMSIYGIEIQEDNIDECRQNLLGVFAEHLTIGQSDDLYLAASYVLSKNIVHGNAMKMLTDDGQPLTFAEWAYLWKGKFQRRDFLLVDLEHSAVLSAPGMLWENRGKESPFSPIRTYEPATITELPEPVEVEKEVA